MMVHQLAPIPADWLPVILTGVFKIFPTKLYGGGYSLLRARLHVRVAPWFAYIIVTAVSLTLQPTHLSEQYRQIGLTEPLTLGVLHPQL